MMRRLLRPEFVLVASLEIATVSGLWLLAMWLGGIEMAAPRNDRQPDMFEAARAADALPLDEELRAHWQREYQCEISGPPGLPQDIALARRKLEELRR